jgi:hypothetical protein
MTRIFRPFARCLFSCATLGAAVTLVVSRSAAQEVARAAKGKIAGRVVDGRTAQGLTDVAREPTPRCSKGARPDSRSTRPPTASSPRAGRRSGGTAAFTRPLATKAGTFVTGTSYRGAWDPSGEKWWQGWTTYARN